MQYSHSLLLVAMTAPVAFSQTSSTSTGWMPMLAKMIPGVIISPNGNLDVAASVCEIFKPGNSFGSALGSMFGSPYNGNQTCEKDTSGGSGKFKANYTVDSTLPAHTIYAPATPPPASEKLPVIIWGNGACMAVGTMFANLLTEIASHGFLVIADGGPYDFGMTTYKDLLTSIDWVTTNPAAKKYGNIDLDNIAIAGQSCGGLEAYQASLNTDKHKLTVLFNSGLINPLDTTTISQLKKPVGYILGGKTDMAFEQGSRDYRNLPKSVPALLADVDVGHIGTYYQLGGGKLGKAGLAFLKWQLKGDTAMKSWFCGSSTELSKDGFNITSKNGMC